MLSIKAPPPSFVSFNLFKENFFQATADGSNPLGASSYKALIQIRQIQFKGIPQIKFVEALESVICDVIKIRPKRRDTTRRKIK